ncbi:uncharacterized protein [Haliotis cracherodii]|uniref:uncharacterized protein n=1 Tax=Haliotis cracherodii TaxID=6455 RepID=UPI0039E9A0DE
MGSSSPQLAIIIGVIGCAACLGLGVGIGYLAWSENPTQEDDDPTVTIPDYQRSCNSECSEEAKVAASCSPELPRHYVANHLNGKTITVDGRLDEDAWKEVPWTENFMDIRGPQFPAPPVETKVKLRWDDQLLYVGAYLQEPHIWATMTQKDTRIYQENAFEVFLDVDNSMSMYKEIEINALSTTWDLMLSRAYMDGGDWQDWEGIQQKGVYTDGAVNNATVPATFWSIEISFPFANLSQNTSRSDRAPVDGEMWFMTLARPRYDVVALANGSYQQKPGTEASWYSWNPTGAVNLHLPSKWGLLFFETDAPSGQSKPVVTSNRWVTYQALFDVFNALKSFKAERGTYVDLVSELDLPLYVTSNTCLTTVNITLAGDGFTVTIEAKKEPGVKGRITQNRYVTFSSQ